MNDSRQTAVIIGAGPAGLTAAYELLTRTDIHPILLEADPEYVGGISRTVDYKGNHIDLGGHRFFSKSDRVMEWWLSMLPLAEDAKGVITYRGAHAELTESLMPREDAEAETPDAAFLVRPRKTRIYYRGKFFDYPVTLSWDTLRKLGFVKLMRIGLTYTRAKLFPRQPETSLEDFFINRFGEELYHTFFKSYTEKVWGVPCVEISAEWGAQRVKGLSVTAVLLNALKKPFRRASLNQKNTETSLIERFLYPRRGPGQLWKVVATRIRDLGGEIRMGERVESLVQANGRVVAVVARDRSGAERRYDAQYVFSTMAIKDLGRALSLGGELRSITDRLPYREFMTAGLLCRRSDSVASGLADTWIYIHDPSVRVGRIQFFNNWSPYLVQDPDRTVWIGLEYFCDEGDELWNTPDAEFLANAAAELERLGLGRAAEVIDGTVIRQPKAYTAYTGSYARFAEVREHLDRIPNLFPIGRNGMHRYNNQDHSMLVAMVAVDNIVAGRVDKANLWDVNAEQEYHEERSSRDATPRDRHADREAPDIRDPVAVREQAR